MILRDCQQVTDYKLEQKLYVSIKIKLELGAEDFFDCRLVLRIAESISEIVYVNTIKSQMIATEV